MNNLKKAQRVLTQEQKDWLLTDMTHWLVRFENESELTFLVQDLVTGEEKVVKLEQGFYETTIVNTYFKECLEDTIEELTEVLDNEDYLVGCNLNENGEIGYYAY